MRRRDHNNQLRVSSDARSLGGALLCVLLPALSWLGLQSSDDARLTTESWLAGDWHTLWTGHLLHYTPEHFVWDALMFVCFALLLNKEEGWRMWAWLFCAAPFISLTVFTVNPQLTEYRGLSALDTMLFTRFCLGYAVSSRGVDRWLFGVLPIGGLVAKIGYELSAGSAFFVSDLGPGVEPLPSAHIAGLICGGIWYISRRLRIH